MQVIEEETNLLLAILKVDKSNLNQEEQERRGKSCTSLKPEAAISTPRGKGNRPVRCPKQEG